ncbi:MAG: hypothetical protein NOOUEUKL_000376, partial [Candidatus Fervidibacter sp.]
MPQCPNARFRIAAKPETPDGKGKGMRLPSNAERQSASMISKLAR